MLGLKWLSKIAALATSIKSQEHPLVRPPRWTQWRKGRGRSQNGEQCITLLGHVKCKEKSAKLYDIIWLDNVNNYDLLQLTGLRIWAFWRRHPIDHWRSSFLPQLHQVQSRWSEMRLMLICVDRNDSWPIGVYYFAKNANRIQGQKAQKQRKIIQPQKRHKKFCHQYQLSARRWTKWTLTPRQAVASFLLFRISLAGDIIVVMNSHLTSVMAL